MRLGGFHATVVALCLAVIAVVSGIDRASAETAAGRIDEALQNISAVVRPGRVGYATFWDGNKFVQCRRTASREILCEAAGTTMQPSLGRVLVPDRLVRLAALGWTLDPHFGNHVRTFPADMATERVAEQISTTLRDVYRADVDALEIRTDWVADSPCPPRSGPSQNLAGSVTDAPSMRATAVKSCSYSAPAPAPQVADTAEALVTRHGATVTGEIQRLRINAARQVFAIFDAGIGYFQCMPDAVTRTLYCEAQSIESWPALAAVLTAERIARLKSAGYADPGRAPNHSKTYRFDTTSDAAIAGEILTLLFEVYGYRGTKPLAISTEVTPR